MTAFTAFALRFQVDTPVVLTHLLHLDGLLGRIVTDDGGDVESLPLARTAGVWHGSAALLETGALGGSAAAMPRVKSLREGTFPEEVLAGEKLSRLRIGEMSPYRPRLRDYQTYRGVRAVWFSALGDRDAVMALCRGVTHLGALHMTGYGRVTAMTALPLAPSPTAGLLFADGLPARALPEPVWQDLGIPRHDRAVVTSSRWQPPYWTGEERICHAPIQADLTGPRRHLVTRLGV